MPSPGSATSPARPVRRRRRRAVVAVASSVLVTAALAGCGGDDPGADPAADPTASTSPSASPTPTATPSPTESSPTASSSPSQTASPTAEPDPTTGTGGSPGALGDALLTAGELPGLNDDFTWRQGRTVPVGSATFGWCSRADALSVGAREGVERQFPTEEATDRAGQQVLDLVDETNARRVEQTFRGWHRDCQGRDGARVGRIQTVAVPAGDAWWYLSNRPRGGGQWEAFGLVREGSRITVLRMQHAGQDHSYDAGQDPLERALRAAAEKLA